MSARRLCLLAALWLFAPLPARSAVLNVVQVVRDSASGLAGASAIAVSPDGQNAYVTSFSGNSVAMFVRDLGADQFRYIGKLVDGVGGVDGLQGASAIAVSADGYSVYVTGQTANALAVFDRSPSLSGWLTYAGVLHEGVDVTYGLAAPTGVAVGPGGRVFVSSSGDNGLSAFDPSYPTLAQVGVWRNGDSNPVKGGTISGMTAASGVVATSGYSGTDVYVSSPTDSAVAVFSNDSDFPLSRFHETQVVQDGIDGFDGLAQAVGLALSPDGRELYVAGTGDSAVAVLDRDPNTSLLGFNSLAKQGVLGVTGLGVVDSVCAEPLGKSVYAGGGQSGSHFSFGSDVVALGVSAFDFSLGFVQSTGLLDYIGIGGTHVAVASLPDSSKILTAESLFAKFTSTGDLSIFDRDPSTGALTAQQTLPQDAGVVGVRGAQSVVASPDGKHVYVMGSNGFFIAEFARNLGSGGLDYIGTVGLPGEDPHAVVPRYRTGVLSPDGHSLYEAHWRGDEILNYLRDPATGGLTPSGGITHADLPALSRPWELVVSPDGASAYAVGGLSPDGWLMAFARDPSTGALTHLQTLTSSDVLALRAANSLAITPDGVHVYVGPGSYDGISVYSRQPNGTLTFLRVYADQPGPDPYDPIQYTSDMQSSPDGSRICVLAALGLACAQRNAATGELGSIQTASTNGHYPDPGALAFSPDGNRIYAVAYDYNQFVPFHSALLVYRLDKATGALTLLEDESDTTGINSVDGAAAVAVSPGGTSIYLAAYLDDDVTVFTPEPGAALLGVAALGAVALVARRRSR